MTLPAHIASGYLAIKFTSKFIPSIVPPENSIMWAGIFGTIIPDIDFVFFKHIKDHHNSIPHTPLFWILLSFIFYTTGLLTGNILLKNHTTAFTIGVLSHLFLDWFGGRTAGIRLFYPFSRKMYSLYPLNPKKGDVSTSLIPTKEHIGFFKFYVQNKFLLSIEILIIIFGLILFILEAV